MSKGQRYDITTPNGERIFTIPGKKGPDDMKILTVFPKMPWAHSLFYIGQCLRLKAEVEDRDYPPEKGFQGRGKLMTFIHDCIFKKDIPLEEICKKHKIPFKE